MNTGKILTAACRWTGRILGTLMVITIITIAVGEGMPNPFTRPPAVLIGFLALAVLMIGMLAGWRWELAGGIISLAGWGLFYAAVMWLKRPSVFVLLLALPGLLYLISARRRRPDKRQS